MPSLPSCFVSPLRHSQMTVSLPNIFVQHFHTPCRQGSVCFLPIFFLNNNPVEILGMSCVPLREQGMCWGSGIMLRVTAELMSWHQEISSYVLICF